MDQHPTRPAHLVRDTVAGACGNILEWYDFAVFGYFAPLIGAHFFPSEDKLASLISAFGAFAAGYLMRPLGGMFFGHIGDRLGRKKALQLSVAMMALPTTMLGLLPGYDSIGIWAAVLLVLLRMVQGLSVGGELIGSISFITENAPAAKRGFFGSLTLFSAVAGVMLGSAVAALLHWVLAPAALGDWGWRLPFLAGILIGGFAFWMREGLGESPEFAATQDRGEVVKNPVSHVLRHMPGSILKVAGLVTAMSGGFYLLFVWWPTYLTNMVQPAVSHAFTVNTLCMIVFMALIPAAGWLSDRWSRRGVVVWSALGLACAAWPLLAWVDHGQVGGALGAGLIFAVLVAGLEGPVPAAMVDAFPPQARFSGIAIGYNLTLGLVGGTAPLVATWLIKSTGDLASPAYYLIALSLLTMAAGLSLERTQKARVAK